MSSPRDAIARAKVVLAGRPGPYVASVAHQAAGIVLRDTGDVDAGVRELKDALRLARHTGSTEREADVLGSLGVALVYSGRTAQGLGAFERAVALASGVLLGRVLHRRGVVYWTLGRNAAALEDLRHAVGVLERAGDLVWTARALNVRGLVYLATGSPARADADFAAVLALYKQTDQQLEPVHVVLNRGIAAFRSGDLPAALAFFDEAESGYLPLNVPTRELSQARCTALRVAGLTTEALTEADAAVNEIERVNGPATERAVLLLAAAECALAAGLPEAALDRARSAYRLFRSQHSDVQARALLAVVQAKHATGQVTARLLQSAALATAQLAERGSYEVAEAHLVAGRVALDLGRRDDAESHLSAAARSRRVGPAIWRASGWLSAALLAEAAGQPRRMLAACRRGLAVLDEHRWTLGASELRALATAHGTELAALALRHAAQARDPRLLLAWTERWRATAMSVPAVRPSPNPELNAGLAALRTVASQLEEASRQGKATAALEREQLRLESDIRTRSLHARGRADTGDGSIDIAKVLAELGSGRLIEIVDVDGLLHVLVCGDGRIRHLIAGSLKDAMHAADFARFALRRLARDRRGSDPDSALAVLKTAGPQLQDALFGPAAGHLGDGPVIVVPPGKLHGIPWAALPALGDRVFSVAPSARAWLTARCAPPPSRQHVTLASGPGLVTGGAEVPLVARLYEDVTTLTGTQATSAAVLSALDGAWLGHVAAHGTFRADSPLFSSLRMDDGPLTVYDFEQLGRAPYRLVLSSCDSGVLAPAGADELLGLVSSLLPLGTSGIVAGVVQLNDHAVVPLMVRLHECLRAGLGLAESLYCVRQDAGSDPTQRAAALSLLTLGAN